MSVMTRLTTARPVRGKLHSLTIFNMPSLVRCSIITMTRFAPWTRSMAPPIPLTSFPGTNQLARSPAAIGPLALLVVLFGTYRRRAVVALVLMAAQAFLYNAIFFTYALVLGRFYRVEAAQIGLYLLPFAAGNFLGPVLLGRLFDTLGRRIMIASTYALSGLLLAATAWAFAHGLLDARALTSCWVLTLR